jgi:hypothetical protein
LSREFGHSNLFISLLEHFESDLFDCRIPDSTTLDLFGDDLLGRISSKFYGLIWSELETIPVSVLFHILSHHLLVISSEDDLFCYISSRVRSDAEYFDLLQFVRFEYLSAECVSYFLSSLPDLIDHRLWESISRRLITLPGLEFPFEEAKSADGIILYLTRKHRGNVQVTGIVTITSKSVCQDEPRYAVQNVAALISPWYFMSKDEPGRWVCWDFHEMRVRPTHYTIKSYRLKSWVVESWLDGEAWTEIDRKTDIVGFKYDWGPASFAVSKPAECRFIRLTQTGKRHNGDDYLSIVAFEFFGTLLE